MTRRRSLSDEEHALWSGVARSITPLPRVRKATEAEAGSDLRRQEERVVPSLPTRGVPPKKNALQVKPPPLAPLERRFKQRVASGRRQIDARIDLHGLTQKEAHAALLQFLRGAQGDGAAIALVITGKGTGTAAGPGERGVLKRQVPMWLSLPEFRQFVVGFDDAHIGHGGRGALYVRLRRLK